MQVPLTSEYFMICRLSYCSCFVIKNSLKRSHYILLYPLEIKCIKQNCINRIYIICVMNTVRERSVLYPGMRGRVAW
jgi:hypothetical protein